MTIFFEAFTQFNMENLNGLESDEEYELDCELLARRNIEVQFVEPEVETCEP